MLAILGAVLCILAGFNVSLGQVTAFDFLAFGVALVAVHLAYPLAIPRRT